MMFKCCECGHLFEEGEQAEWYENYGAEIGSEKFCGCPLCRGGYECVYQCKKCGKWHDEDDLYEGWCEECLRETINFDTFFEYCEANKKNQYLDIFVIEELIGGMKCPDVISDEFHALMVDTYKRKVAGAKLIGKASALLGLCVRFILEYDGCFGKENYAEWLNEKGVR